MLAVLKSGAPRRPAHESGRSFSGRRGEPRRAARARRDSLFSASSRWTRPTRRSASLRCIARQSDCRQASDRRVLSISQASRCSSMRRPYVERVFAVEPTGVTARPHGQSASHLALVGANGNGAGCAPWRGGGVRWWSSASRVGCGGTRLTTAQVRPPPCHRRLPRVASTTSTTVAAPTTAAGTTTTARPATTLAPTTTVPPTTTTVGPTPAQAYLLLVAPANQACVTAYDENPITRKWISSGADAVADPQEPRDVLEGARPSLLRRRVRPHVGLTGSEVAGGPSAGHGQAHRVRQQPHRLPRGADRRQLNRRDLPPLPRPGLIHTRAVPSPSGSACVSAATH